MILEGLDEVNIKDLAIEGPKPPTFDIYDPYSFVPDNSLWEEIESEKHDNPRSKDYFLYLGAVKRLFPDRFGQFSLSEDYCEFVLSELPILKERDFKISYCDLALAVQAILPARFPQIIDQPGIFEWLSSDYKEGLRFDETFLDSPALLKTVFPEKYSKLMQEEEDWNWLIGQHVLLDSKDKPNKLATESASLRVLFPERLSEINIDKSTLECFIDYIKSQYGTPNFDFLELLENLQILLATELKFTDQGLVTILPTQTLDFNEQIQMPVRRVF